MEKKVSRIFILGIWIIGALTQSARPLEDQNQAIKKSLKIPAAEHVQILTLVDGSTLIGRISSIGETEIEFQSDLGISTIPIGKIREIKEVPASSIRNGLYWFPNPNATRLYFAPTGRMLEKGQGYFADYYIFFPMAVFGISDHVTVGAGMSLFPGIGFNNQFFYFTPKVGLKATERFSLAAGALIINLPDFDEDESTFAGILYGVGTYGTPDLSFTAGLGYGFVERDLAEKPMVMAGLEARLSRRISFVSENWVFPGVDEPVVSYGLRLFGEKISVDLAFFQSLGNLIFPGIPYVDFVYNF